MAKRIKPVEDDVQQPIELEQPIAEEVPDGIVEPEKPKEKPIYIPDIPAQMIEQPIENKIETETEFLLRILQIQEDGGFGRHLNKVIYDRIKLIS